MKKRVPRAVRQLDKPEASLGLEPFYDGAYRRARWCFKAWLAEARGAAKFAEMRVIAVVVEITAPALTKIPISDQVSFLSSRFTARSDRRKRLFQKIAAGASGLIVTITTYFKTPLGEAPGMTETPSPEARHPVRRHAAKRKVDSRRVAETQGD
jgi:hypothetical protein